MPWFWDLLALSSQIPLCLPNLPNLLAQSFNQILHRNLSNLNHNAWLLVPQISSSKASIRQLQNELRLPTEAQPDHSMKQSGQYLQNGARVIRWTSGLQSIKSIVYFLLYPFQDRKLKRSMIDGYKSAIANKLENSPINVTKRENHTHLLCSFHRDKPKGHRGIPLGTFLWYFTSSQRLPLNPLESPP